MIENVNGRRVMSCRQAAQLLGVTMGRVRQMARAGDVWSAHVTERALILDAEEVEKVAALREAARAAGMMPGARPGGFKPDRPTPEERTERDQITTAEAAEILGVSMARMRQLALDGVLWSWLPSPTMRFYDRAEVEARKEQMSTYRGRGRRPGGFTKG